MKSMRLFHKEKKGNGYLIVMLLMIPALFLNLTASFAQDAKDSLSKLSMTMRLTPLLSNGTRAVKVNITRKLNKKIINVNNLKSPLNLYLNEVKEPDPVTGEGWIGKCYLNIDGEGIFSFPSNFYQLTQDLHQFNFIVKLSGDPLYEDAEENVTVSDAKISIEYQGDDSIKSATAALRVWKGNGYGPLSKAELKLCIKRTFNFLPFGETGGSTDDSGKISGDLPLDIPGNPNGTLTLAARLEDDETYGTVEITKDVPWKVLPKQNAERGRTLWSGGANAPLLLVFSSLTIIIIIWGTIFYLVYLLYRIKQLGKAH
jgi:hypothetical protein